MLNNSEEHPDLEYYFNVTKNGFEAKALVDIPKGKEVRISYGSLRGRNLFSF